MKTEQDLEGKIDSIAIEFKSLPEKSLWEKTKKAAYLVYALEVGGSLIRRYQKRLAENIGWKEHHLTTANALVLGAVPALAQIYAAYALEDRIGATTTNVFSGVQGLYLTQALARTAYSQYTKKAIGAIGMVSFFANSIYIFGEIIKKEIAREKRNKSRNDIDEILM